MRVVCVCVCASCCCRRRRRLAGLVASDTSFARSSSSSSSSFWQGMGTYRVAIRPLHARQCLLGIGKRKKEHFTCSRTLQEKEKTAKLLIYFISFHLLRTFFFHFFFFFFFFSAFFSTLALSCFRSNTSCLGHIRQIIQCTQPCQWGTAVVVMVVMVMVLFSSACCTQTPPTQGGII